METNDRLIICVGRQVGSGGLTIARRLADRFGCKLMDRELLNLAARESGLAPQFFQRGDERRGFFRAIAHITLPLLSGGNLYHSNLSDESLYQFQSEAIARAAAEADCVFVGRTADYVLRHQPGLINIFVSAPLADRVKRVAEKLGIGPEAAEKHIHDEEDRRATYYNYYTGKQWGAARSYDLCVDSSRLGIDQTADLLAEYIERRRAVRNASLP